MSPQTTTESSNLLGQHSGSVNSMSSANNSAYKRSRSGVFGGSGFPLTQNMTVWQALNLAIFACSILLLAIARNSATQPNNSHSSEPLPPVIRKAATTNSKYKQVQGIGFQIYTGGAPAFFNVTEEDGSVSYEPNPECLGLNSYGSMWTEEGEVLQCYLGNHNVTEDIQHRLQIMKDAVLHAYHMSESRYHETTLKVFIAPEFFWRGPNGAYIFQDEKAGDESVCGPVCQILQGLEEIVADRRFEDWFFLFGSIIAADPIKDDRTEYDSLFYNFAPVYKGYDPKKTSHVGKRFIAPKRYLSTSDFMTPQRHLNLSNWQELIDSVKTTTHQKNTVINPIYTRGKYDFDLYTDYKAELDHHGYALLDYAWLMVDGVSVSLEICLDHQVKTALNAYTADMTTGRNTLIPSISDKGLEYVPIPEYQAQIGIVSSAGMTLVPEALVLTQQGVIFLQDGLSNATNRAFWSTTGCELGLQFEGGTEAVTRRAFVSSTDVYFEHLALDSVKRYDLYPEEKWQKYLNGSFTTKVYPPQLTIFNPVDIAKVHRRR